jgi:hypothetical protein
VWSLDLRLFDRLGLTCYISVTHVNVDKPFLCSVVINIPLPPDLKL